MAHIFNEAKVACYAMCYAMCTIQAGACCANSCHAAAQPTRNDGIVPCKSGMVVLVGASHITPSERCQHNLIIGSMLLSISQRPCSSIQTCNANNSNTNAQQSTLPCQQCHTLLQTAHDPSSPPLPSPYTAHAWPCTAPCCRSQPPLPNQQQPLLCSTAPQTPSKLPSLTYCSTRPAPQAWSPRARPSQCRAGSQVHWRSPCAPPHQRHWPRARHAAPGAPHTACAQPPHPPGVPRLGRHPRGCAAHWLPWPAAPLPFLQQRGWSLQRGAGLPPWSRPPGMRTCRCTRFSSSVTHV